MTSTDSNPRACGPAASEASETSKVGEAPSNDPHTELHEATLYLLSCIKDVVNEGKATTQTQEANEYLRTRLLNYLVLMRKRNLQEAYEFIHTTNGGWGWYYKGREAEHVNWFGPFTSRKAAIEARTNRVQKLGAPRTPLNVLERQLLEKCGVA